MCVCVYLCVCVCLCVYACTCTLTSTDFSTYVFTLAVVTLTVFAVDASVPRWMAGTLSTQALTYKKTKQNKTDCPVAVKFQGRLLHVSIFRLTLQMGGTADSVHRSICLTKCLQT